MIMPSFVNVQRTLVNHPTWQYLSFLIGPDNKEIYFSNALREGAKKRTFYDQAGCKGGRGAGGQPPWPRL